MIRFSTDPQVAEQQMHAIIFYLTTFGYIDGDFDESEKDYVRDYVRKLVEQRVATGMPDADPTLRGELVARFSTHFLEVFENIDRYVRDLFTEAVAQNENQDAFIHAKLKLKCFELFQGFDRDSQEVLMEAVDELINADGQVHPAEAKFRAELVELFHADLGLELEPDFEAPRTTIASPIERRVSKPDHPFFGKLEFHYSADKDKILQQIELDRQLLDQVRGIWTKQRAGGSGRLAGAQKVDDFAGEQPFLDGHVYVCPATHPAGYELTVLGDLHGCYSCLKGAVMQAEFFDKVAAFKKDPSLPKPLLVLLGDYIDRGLFSLNGVLRSALQMFVAAPEHVYVLRGNHEYYIEYKGQIFGGVKPAEAINTLKPHLPIDVFRDYMSLFDEMPSALLFDRTLFVHAGIPRDLLVKERWRDMSFLNDPDARFQMMWSDPSSADVIPAALQEQSARFPFGRMQAAAFLHRMGCHTIVRGHEKVDSGFARVYDDDQLTLITLFSAGGRDNEDLPADSSYRGVTPKAMTLTSKDGQQTIVPWDIDFRTFNDPARNAFFKAPPEIELRK
ncbi:MAG: metallophosphoesterase [Myxococcales bacterium]|nr:metallophosphoesterase [Myxococcales bacterium]